MAEKRGPKGPLGNAPRDMEDDAVGEPAERLAAGKPMRWPPNPRRITKDTFHAKVSGERAAKRADRAPTYRRGGWVHGGSVKPKLETGEDSKEREKEFKRGGHVRKRESGGDVKESAAAQLAGQKQTASPPVVAGLSKERGYAAGGHITTKQRKSLPSKDFALPGHGKGAGGKGPGSYPIDTAARARNALARGAQHASPGELATIKRKVHAKYPGIGEKKD